MCNSANLTTVLRIENRQSQSLQGKVLGGVDREFHSIIKYGVEGILYDFGFEVELLIGKEAAMDDSINAFSLTFGRKVSNIVEVNCDPEKIMKKNTINVFEKL